MFTKARQLSLYWDKLIRSTTSHPISVTPLLILSSYLRSGLPRGLFSSGFSILSPVHHTSLCPRSLNHLQTYRTCRDKAKVSIPDNFATKHLASQKWLPYSSVPAVLRKPRKSAYKSHKSVRIGKDAVLSAVTLRRSIIGCRRIHKTCRLCLTGQWAMKVALDS